MSNLVNRRKFLTLTSSIAVVGIAGCSDNESPENTSDEQSAPTEPIEPTENQTTQTTQTSTSGELEPETPIGEPEEISGNTINSLSDYRYIATQESWIGEEVQVNNVNYVQEYGDSYKMFRAFYEDNDVGRPFMIKTTKIFEENQEISFTGIIEKVEEIQGVNVIFIDEFRQIE